MDFQFEILINDCFMGKKFTLSLSNDYEDGEWRYEKFSNFIWDSIQYTALSAKERNYFNKNNLHTSSNKSAKANLRKARILDRDGNPQKDLMKRASSELGEIFLYGLLHFHFNALPVVPKIFYKQNTQDNAKGADSVHIMIDASNNDFSLWFGEAKFYNNIGDSRLDSIIESVEKSLQTSSIKKENSIICGLNDLDFLLQDKQGLLRKIKQALDPNTSIDTLKSKIHIPILILYQCSISEKYKIYSDKYKTEISNYHKDRAKKYFEKQDNKLKSTIHLYDEIFFHFIIFPIPSEDRIIEDYLKELGLLDNGQSIR
jgi:hypothetical protein